MRARIVFGTRSLAIGAAALLAFTAAAARGARAQDTSARALPTERNVGPIRPGDVIRIAVYKEKEMTGDFSVDARGILQIPGLGDIPVGGLNPVEIKTRLKDELSRRGVAEPELSVQPLIRVSVLGEVKAPGVHPVDPGTTLLQLLTLVGGTTEKADLKKAHVLR
ncbi:MAG: polysaccharide biosynthesis/export family protein, partial [Gemmatimonadaceae bacterium]